MSRLQDELERFTEFALRYQRTGRTLTEVFDLWMLKRVSDDDFTQDIAAINASIQDFLNGERGTPAGEHSRQLRAELDLGK